MEAHEGSVSTQDELKGANAPAVPLDSDCPICLQKYLHPVRLPCNHVFCYLCCKGEVLKRKRCAMCRSEIPPEYFYDPNLLDNAQQTSESNLEDGYQWFYEGKNGWWQYDERSSVEIEQNYSSGETSIEILIAGHLYVINFEQMRQHRKNAPGRYRKIKRDLCTVPKKGVAGLTIKRVVIPDVPDTRPEADGNETEKSDQAQGVSHSQSNRAINDTTPENEDGDTARVRCNPELSVKRQSNHADLQNGNVQNSEVVNRDDLQRPSSTDEYVYLRLPSSLENTSTDTSRNGRPLREGLDNGTTSEKNDNKDSITHRVLSETKQSHLDGASAAPVTKPRLRARRSRTNGSLRSCDQNPSRDEATSPDQAQRNSKERSDLMHNPVTVPPRSYPRTQDVNNLINPSRSSVESDSRNGEESSLVHSLADISIGRSDESDAADGFHVRSKNGQVIKRNITPTSDKDDSV